MLVSSVKKVGFTYLTESSKLFIYIENNIGPRMDPCGTPYLMYDNKINFKLIQYDILCFLCDTTKVKNTSKNFYKKKG